MSSDEIRRRVSVAVLPNTTNTIRTPLRTVACWRLGDGVFQFDHKIIGRGARDEFAAFWAIRDRHPTAPIALFGHADPTGDVDYNHWLAAQRAQAVYAVLNGDPDMWFELFANDPESLAELKRMLAPYGIDLDEPGYGERTREAVAKHFEFLGGDGGSSRSTTSRTGRGRCSRAASSTRCCGRHRRCSRG